MLGYATLGSSDLDKAVPFYDAVLGELGLVKVFDHPRGGRMYGSKPGSFEFGILKPYDESAATPGNGTMIAFQCDNHDQIRAAYAKAIDMGATCEGEPGWRGDEGGFFGAYFRDLDGNKLCAYRMGPA